jgi:iron complex transport system substrate-binding protein
LKPAPADRGRRLVLGACVAAPLGAGALLAGRLRAAVVGARDFADSDIAPGPFPKPLRGPTGEPRLLPRPPRRIVSTYLGADELLAALVDPARVAAVSAYVDDAATSNARGVFSPGVPRLRSDPEVIIVLDPDLVCVAGFTEPDTLRLLAGAGLPLLRWSRFDSFADIVAEVRLFGAAVGEEARASAIAGGIEALLAELEGRLAGVRPKRVLYYDPPAYTMGRATLVGEILARAGGANVVDALGIAGPGEIDLETILALDPEEIVMPSYADNVGPLGELSHAAIWREIPAVRAGRVHLVPGAAIATVSHHAARALAHVAHLLHPEAFAVQTK